MFFLLLNLSCMDIHALLNPEEVVAPLSRVLGIGVGSSSERERVESNPTHVDILPLLKQLSMFSNKSVLRAPQEIKDGLQATLAFLQSHPTLQSGIALQAPADLPHYTEGRTQSTDIKLNKTTTLELLYTYPAEAVVEYPETSASGRIGHLFPWT